MTRSERLNRAASRYGLTDPSPDDILGAHWTAYNHDKLHTTGYHRDYDAVMAIVDRTGRRSLGATHCKICGGLIPETSKRNKRYCSMRCRQVKQGQHPKRDIPKDAPVRTPLEPHEQELAVELYMAGWSIEDVAKKVGCSRQRARMAIKGAGVEIKARGVPSARRLVA